MDKPYKCETCGAKVSKLSQHHCRLSVDLPRTHILILGHAQHGKDTVAEYLRDSHGLPFISSSLFVAEHCLWEKWGKDRYSNLQTMYEDRHNHRPTWHQLIAEYNTPDKTRTAREMYAAGYSMYVGMRAMGEFIACMRLRLFTHVLWVHREGFPPEPTTSFNIPATVTADIFDNSGTIQHLHDQIDAWVDANL